MPRKKHDSGFVYIWMDKKHKRFYIGSHWGSPEDGYICSSTWMRNAYRNRPQDFKRRVLKVITTNKYDLHEEEHRWLQMMKSEELKGIRYYNICNSVKNVWHKHEASVKTIGQKISLANTGKKQNFIDPVGRGKKISEAKKGVKFSEEHKAKLKESRSHQVQSPEANEKRRESVRKSWELRKINKSKSSTEMIL